MTPSVIVGEPSECDATKVLNLFVTLDYTVDMRLNGDLAGRVHHYAQSSKHVPSFADVHESICGLQFVSQESDCGVRMEQDSSQRRRCGVPSSELDVRSLLTNTTDALPRFCIFSDFDLLSYDMPRIVVDTATRSGTRLSTARASERPCRSPDAALFPYKDLNVQPDSVHCVR